MAAVVLVVAVLIAQMVNMSILALGTNVFFAVQVLMGVVVLIAILVSINMKQVLVNVFIVVQVLTGVVVPIAHQVGMSINNLCYYIKLTSKKPIYEFKSIYGKQFGCD